MDPLEIWWSKDGRTLIRIGDRVIVRHGGEWLSPIPFKGKMTIARGVGIPWDLNELASAENYLRKVRALARDRETHTTSERRGGVLKLTLNAGLRHDVIEVDARTKRLLRAETIIGEGDSGTRWQLDRFTYDQPFPSHVLDNPDSVLQPQNHSILKPIPQKGGDE